MADARLNILLAFRNDLRGLTGAVEEVGGLARGLVALGAAYVSVSSVANGARDTVVKAADFQTAMNGVQAFTNASAAQMRAMGDLAKELGATTQYSTSQVAEAMGRLALAGLKPKQIMEAIAPTLNLAASAQMNLADAASIVTNVMYGYGEAASNLGSVSDVLAKAFTNANTNLADIGIGMKYAGGTAHQLGVSLEETVSALAMLSNAGISGSSGGTALRGILVRLIKPTKQARDALDRLGIEVTDGGGKMKSLADITEQFEKAQKKAASQTQYTADVMAVFGREVGPGMLALIEQGPEKIREFTASLRDSGGTAERVGGVQMRGLRGAWAELTGAVENAQISMMDGGNAIGLVSEKVKGVADGVKNATPYLQAFVAETVKAMQNGDLGEWIRIVIGAGFEQGTKLAGELWRAFISQDFQAPLWTAIASLGVNLFTSLISAASKVVAFISAGFQWIGANLGHWIGNKFEEAVAERVSFVKAGFASGGAAGRIGVAALGQIEKAPKSDESANSSVPSFDELWRQQSDYMSEGVAGLRGLLNAQLQEMTAILNGGKATNEAGTYSEMLRKRLEAQKRAQDEATAAAKKEADAQSGGAEVKKKTTEGVEEEAQALRGLSSEEIELLKIRIEGLRFERQQILQLAQKRHLTEAEKTQLKSLADQERKALDVLIDHYQRVAKEAKNAEERAKAVLMVQQLSAARKSVGKGDESAFKSKWENTRDRFNERGSEAESYQGVSQGAMGGAMEYFTQLGTTANQVAGVVRDTLGTAIQGIGDGIARSIVYAEDLGSALRNVGATILSSVISAIIQMGIQWVATRLMMWIFGESLNAASVTASMTEAHMLTAAWSPAAVAAAIATMGSATAGGAAAMTLIASSSMLGAVPGFATGGVPYGEEGVFRGLGSGTSDSNLIRISDGEGILNAAVTRSIGAAGVNRLNRAGAKANRIVLPQFAAGGVPGAAADTRGPVGASNWGGAPVQNVKVVAVFSPEEAQRELERTPAFERAVLRVFNGNARRV